MFDAMKPQLQAELQKIREAGLWKDERVLASAQGPEVRLADGREVLVFCANNYLGLSSDPRVIEAARASLDERGYGLSSVRFICGTQELHKQLEGVIAKFLGKDDAILYSSCWDANGGLFETILGEDDAILSDELNHASIIDGIRLCKAKRWRYKNGDVTDLERCLKESAGTRLKLIATDGVFSMDGDVAPLGEICDLAERHDALVMVDDSHATGFFGPTGRGTPEHCGVAGRVDIVTSTLGKALGGASGGFTASRREVVALLRQRSRPYLFSNTLALSGSADHTVRLWDLESRQEIISFTGHSGSVTSVAFSPVDFTMLSSSADGTLRLWDLQSTQIIREFDQFDSVPLAVAFSLITTLFPWRPAIGTVAFLPYAQLAELGRQVERFYGEPRAFTIDDEPAAEAPEAAWRLYESHHGEVVRRWRERRSLETKELGRINHRQERARLAVRSAELRLHRGKAEEAEVERARRAFDEVQEWAAAEHRRVSERIAALNAENARYALIVETANGQEKRLALAGIVRAYPANRLSTVQKLGVYASRWKEFLIDDPREANTEGGVFPAIFGTVMMVMLMSVMVTPLGVLAAFYLREYARQGTFVSAVRIAVNNLAGVPSIVFGVFGVGFFIYIVGGSIDRLFFPEALPTPTYGTGGILWASLTLGLLTVPVVIVAAEEALAAQDFVSPVDVLLGIRWLESTGERRWRRGMIDCLEEIIHTDPARVAEAMKLFRSWAAGKGLVASEAEYVARTPQRAVLRFTRSGDREVERLYGHPEADIEDLITDFQGETVIGVRVHADRPEHHMIDPEHPTLTAALTANGGSVLLTHTVIGAVTARVPVAALDGLARLPFVVSISIDAVVTANQSSGESTLRGTLGLPINLPTGNRVGVATFTAVDGGARLGLSVTGLRPGLHGIHIHETGTCTPPEFTSAGGHLNPESRQHGLENPRGPHAGDLPNLKVEANGSAKRST